MEVLFYLLMNGANPIINMIDNHLKPPEQVTYKSIKNKDQIVVSTTETTIFLLSWTQKQRGSTVIKSLLNTLSSTASLLTFSLVLDGTDIVTLKHAVVAGEHNISFNKLYQNLKQGPHKLEVKANTDVGTLTIDINQSRQVVIT